jgi:hypothetical protein
MPSQMALFIELGENSGMHAKAKRNFPKNVRVSDDPVFDGCLALMAAVMQPVIRVASKPARTRDERRQKMLALAILRDNDLFTLTVELLGDNIHSRLKRSGIDIGG